MKQFRYILSFFFALLVLFSSSSFIVGLHVCGGNVRNMALFTKAEGCANEKKLPPCHRHKSTPCCQDETVVHDAQGFKSEVTGISFAKAPIAAIVQPSVLLTEIVPSLSALQPHFYNYDPPLRLCDLTVALQVFRI